MFRPMASVTAASILLVLLIASPPAASATNPAAKVSKPVSKLHDGFEITLVSIERIKEQRTGGAVTQPIKEGFELAVVRIEVRPAKPSGKKELKLEPSQLEILDAAGKTYKAEEELSFTFGSSGRKLPADVIFGVPEGAKLVTLRIGKVKFTLK